jgi:hypothetical protein
MENKNNADPPRESYNISIPIERLPDSNIMCLGKHTNPKLIGFAVKVIISILILSFSFFKLHYTAPCDCSDDNVVYVSLISSILSFWTGQHIK